MWSIKIDAYGGANIVPIAVPDICLQNLESNSNNLFLRTKSAILTILSVDTVLLEEFSYYFLRMSKPSRCGIKPYNICH